MTKRYIMSVQKMKILYKLTISAILFKYFLNAYLKYSARYEDFFFLCRERVDLLLYRTIMLQGQSILTKIVR
jgi:hypothetical protein